MHGNEPEIPAGHDDQKDSDGNADTPGEGRHGTVRLSFIVEQEKQSAAKAGDSAQEQDNDNDCHEDDGRMTWASVIQRYADFHATRPD